MTSSIPKSATLKGGEWLIKECDPFETFTPEDLSEEQKMILEMCNQFLQTEVIPVLDRIDKMEPGLMRSLLQKCGDLGLLGAAVPEEYGGLGKHFITSGLVTEGLAQGHSFTVAHLAHIGIGSMPILYYGTDEQRLKYITKLASGEWIGSYALTEPSSGSDSLAAKTTAKLSDDGKHYILNGQKCWITNGGIADVFTVFAKVDGDKFSTFIVEKGFEGFSIGKEENKLGIKGSSTVQLFFQDCKVPVENVLGEIGNGQKIAFNILNVGRYKMCVCSISASKATLNSSLNYALTREQFNTPIANFGAIKHKLAEMAINVWVGDSATYHTGHLITNKEEELLDAGEPFGKAFLGAAEEYACESSLLKVFGSEVQDSVTDEGLQIHGGNGFSEEYEITRSYRDSRINRIFEGTNEINRMLAVNMLIKYALKGKLDILGHAHAIFKELKSPPQPTVADDDFFASEKKAIAGFKKAIIMLIGSAMQKLGKNLETEQEVMMNISDMAINAYTAECALLRAMKQTATYGETATLFQADMIRTYFYDAASRINKYGKDALNRFVEGEELLFMHAGIDRFTKTRPFDTIAARRRIAEKMIEEKKYCF